MFTDILAEETINEGGLGEVISILEKIDLDVVNVFFQGIKHENISKSENSQISIIDCSNHDMRFFTSSDGGRSANDQSSSSDSKSEHSQNLKKSWRFSKNILKKNSASNSVFFNSFESVKEKVEEENEQDTGDFPQKKLDSWEIEKRTAPDKTY